VDETKIGDDGLSRRGYPTFLLMQKAPDRKRSRVGIDLAKPGPFDDRSGKRARFPRYHRTVHRAAGITRQSSDWPR
jgi:hypothetical protein